jgi:hypothetical protein
VLRLVDSGTCGAIGPRGRRADDRRRMDSAGNGREIMPKLITQLYTVQLMRADEMHLMVTSYDSDGLPSQTTLCKKDVRKTGWVRPLRPPWPGVPRCRVCVTRAKRMRDELSDFLG